MTDTTNGWRGQPGVPLNPEKDGWHWVRGHNPAEKPYPQFWSRDAAGFSWWSSRSWRDEAAAKHWTYLGPCLTPDEATALQARVAELEPLVKPAFTEGFNAGLEEGKELGEFTANGGDARRHEGRGPIWHWQNSETKAALEGKKT